MSWQPFTVPDPVGYDVTRWVWTRTPDPIRLSASRFLCLKEGRGNFRESRLLVTSDRGDTWDTVRTPFAGYEAYAPWAFSMRFADSLVGWAAIRVTLADSLPDWRWLVSRTTDGGFSWHIVFADTVWNRHVNPSVMWAGDSSRVMLGSSALVLRSVDGGASWSYDSVHSSVESKPTYAPLHPTGAWPVFGVNGFAVSKILRYGIPPSTTGVAPFRDERRRLSFDNGINILDLRADASLLHVRFVTRMRGPVSVRLFDLNGALRYRRDLEGEEPGDRSLEIPADQLPVGLYAVRIVTDGAVDGRVVPILKR